MENSLLNEILNNSIIYQMLKDNHTNFSCYYQKKYIVILTYNRINEDGSLSIKDYYIIKVKNLKENDTYQLLITKNNEYFGEELLNYNNKVKKLSK